MSKNCYPCNVPTIGSNYVKYNGPNLPCTNIHTCDNLSVALQKIDEQICNLQNVVIFLQNQINNLNTTTSTTTLLVL
jgi:hypothetical protein